MRAGEIALCDVLLDLVRDTLPGDDTWVRQLGCPWCGEKTGRAMAHHTTASPGGSARFLCVHVKCGVCAELIFTPAATMDDPPPRFSLGRANP